MTRRHILSTLLVVAVLFVENEVVAQRQILSLGSKLVNRRPSRSQQKEYVVQGEDEGFWMSWRKEYEENDFMNSALSIVTILLVSLIAKKARTDQEEDGDDDELVIEQDVDAAKGMDHVDLGFEQIKMTLKQKGKKPDRVILDGSVRGRAKPGRMLAIMGPSGSGKSTLLHALAGKIKENKKLSLYGRRYVNGKPVSGNSMIPAAMIEQSVNFFPHMTVRETLDFRVELKMGKGTPKSERDEVVDELLNTLSLTKSANTIVGNAKIRGLSGGEKKRLSIAVEMINSPSLIFLDEPTSGLDSYQAAQVVQTLRTLADAGKTVVAVIHQPSQQVFQMFDDLLLLSEGKQMYFGERNRVRSYLETMGYTAERETGTAEHVLECVSPVNGGSKAEQESFARINTLAERNLQASKEVEICPGACHDHKEKLQRFVEHKRGPRAGILLQFKLLLGRAGRELFRGKGAIIIKIVQQVALGLIYGGIYNLGNNQASIQDRIGLLSLIAIGTANMAMAATIRTFPKEKAIVSNEIASHMYGTLPYFIAKAISEIPLIGVFSGIFSSIVYKLTHLQKGRYQKFLGIVTLHSIAAEAVGLVVGAVSATSDIALALFPPIIVLNIIFDGKNISQENTPRLLRWIPKVGLIRWGFEGLALNEFDGLTFEAGPPRRGPVARTGEEALDRFGLTGRTLKDVVTAQTGIISACWLMSYVGLSLTRQRFIEMKAPVEDNGTLEEEEE